MPFRAILETFVRSHPEVRGVIFCDEEGERVDAAIAEGNENFFELEVTGASLATILRQLERYGTGSSLRTRHHDRTVMTQLIESGYYVTALCERSSVEARLVHDLAEVAEALREHM